MTTIAERKKIAKMVLTIKDDNVINKIKCLLDVESKTARAKYIKQYNKEIDEAIARIESGKYYTEKQANALLAKWQKEVLSGIKRPGMTL